MVDCWRYMIIPPWGQHDPKVEFCHHQEMKMKVFLVDPGFCWDCRVFSDLPGQQVWIGPEDSQCEGNIGSIAGLKEVLGTSREFIQHPCCFDMFFVWFCDGTKHLNHFDLSKLSQNAWGDVEDSIFFSLSIMRPKPGSQKEFPPQYPSIVDR